MKAARDLDLSYPVAAVHCSLKGANPSTALEGKHILEALFDKNVECFFHRVDSDGKYEVELIDFSPQPNTSVVVASGMNVMKQQAVSPVLMKGQAESPVLMKGQAESPVLMKGQAVSPILMKGQAVSPVLMKQQAVPPVLMKQQAVSPVLMKGQAVSPALIDLEAEESDLRRPSCMVMEQAIFPALIDLEPEETDMSGAVFYNFLAFLNSYSPTPINGTP